MFTEFTPTDAKTTIGGNGDESDRRARSRSTLKIEFIDKAGTWFRRRTSPSVRSRRTASATFTATGTGAGIVAFRYGPIS